MRDAFSALFTPEYRRRTIVNSLLFTVSIVGLWAGSIYVPAAVTQIARREGAAVADAARMASYATMLLSTGTILGCVALPWLAEAYGRRMTLAGYFVLMFLSIAIGFGYVFYLSENPLRWFLVCLFFLGIGGANFAMYTLWLPEQYATNVRATAFAFCTSIGRLVGAGVMCFGDPTLRTRVVRTAHGVPRLFERPRQLHTAALAAPTGMNLRLDDPHRPAQPARHLDRLGGRIGHSAARHRDTEFRQQLFRLIFVDIHRLSPRPSSSS